LKQHGNLISRDGRRGRSPALVCLCLMMHALFVCLTHHHGTAQLSSTTVITASAGDSQTAKDAGSDAGCLSCRLQRHLVADPHAAAIGPEPVAEALLYDTLLAPPHTWRLATSLFGRAPPLV